MYDIRKSLFPGAPTSPGAPRGSVTAKVRAERRDSHRRASAEEKVVEAKEPARRLSTGVSAAVSRSDSIAEEDRGSILAAKGLANETDFSDALLALSNESNTMDLELGELVRRFQLMVTDNSRAIAVLEGHISALAPIGDDESKE
ncbi:hypothetical protein TGPRC2_273310 [Toxoplasma gondii TgCatPRC2]|uniref:Uncharacterized protein n=15 Tax=Toxoplasma gondii TaxID=5811 RepID=B9PFV9_TOXGV|nr:hypothetical protein TGME49_273310 [Toxoplasma gondii ME49]EPR64515.1 hypothetical protein TGGT1_273310 [Toxoplasma gondii GT1]ESS35985.1 hypothetical protein TGVEG_273310 [Toxoplasma gondii VEG]KAF4642059.1 hypothetical protein TGRH88_078720 [Toxoplasma gondii]KFG28743.1 hypothetical protein TGDOM2_273310 [Toxoplasma gondii GAB2-2007-GAL-DOM2]KFG50121.1 hypothetical protein TGFOU_273310 [Toxoplasma gondii FOU]KFG51683.1 hypothetical protein TGP89_273310 [Toxoplasma gondii p89]KFG64054.1 |eukprot:XP_018636721.1 hypothetical protein TGME49_273310 [Toxoplasma gondii ME49]